LRHYICATAHFPEPPGDYVHNIALQQIFDSCLLGCYALREVAFLEMTKSDPMAESNGSDAAPVTIKKYANRRLYNTATSSYVTLDYLCQMVKDGIDFVVFDAKTGDDITRSVLTQIIVDEEAKGQNLLPISFLRQLIGYYGDNMQQTLLPQYLEHSMKTFSRNQEQMQEYMRESLGGMFPMGQLEEMGRQNMAMFEKAMQVFSPYGNDGAGKAAPVEPDQKTETVAKEDDQINALERKLDALQAQIEAMSQK
jgi:polyhydroxyalkanoate synthesis repressor PhaR